MKALKIVALSLCIGVAAVVIGFFAWVMILPEGGVKLANEIDDYALEYLASHSILEDGEQVLAYYDVTLSMDGSEAAILTDRRVLYHKSSRTTAIALAEIGEISHRYEDYVGDVIEVQGRDGQTMKIEIAPLNQGESFARALQASHERAAQTDPS